MAQPTFVSTTGFQSGTGALSGLISNLQQNDILLFIYSTANQASAVKPTVEGGPITDLPSGYVGTGTAGSAGAVDIGVSYHLVADSSTTRNWAYADSGSYNTLVGVVLRGVDPTQPFSGVSTAVDASATTTIQKLLSAPSSNQLLCIGIGLDRDASSNPYLTWAGGSVSGTWTNALTGNTGENNQGAITNAGAGGGIYAQFVDSNYAWTGASTFADSTTHAYVSFYVNGVDLSPVTQAAYRFYATGSEIAATPLANQDVGITADVVSANLDGAVRLRLQATTTAAVAALDDWQLQYDVGGSGSWSNVGASGPIQYRGDADLINGGATTNRLTGGSGSFVAGKVSEDGLVDDLGWSGSNYTELYYGITVNRTLVNDGEVYRLRVLRNGSTDQLTYSQYPTITINKSSSTPKTGSDAPSVSVGDSASMVVTGQNFFPTDTATVAVGDVAQITRKDIDVSDTTTLAVGDVAGFTDKTFALTDTATIAVGDVKTLDAASSRTDTATVAVGDASAVVKAMDVVNTATVAVGDVAAITAKGFDVSDTATVAVGDAQTSSSTLSVVEAPTIGVSEAQASSLTNPVSDSMTIAVGDVGLKEETGGGTTPKDVTDTLTIGLLEGHSYPGEDVYPGDDVYPVSGGTEVSDTFTRSNSSNNLGFAETGQQWVQYGTSKFGISNGKACYPTPADYDDAAAYVEVGSSDMTVTIRFCTGPTTNQEYQLNARYGASGAYTIAGRTSSLDLLRNGGTLTVGPSWVANDLITLSTVEESTGTRVIAKKNGTEFYNAIDTNASRPTGTKASFDYINTVFDSIPYFDDFSVVLPGPMAAVVDKNAGGPTTVSGSTTVTVGVSDSAALVVQVAVSDTATVAVGDVSSFATSAIAVTNTVTVAVGDNASTGGSSTPNVSDTATISVGDVAAITAKTIDVSDTTTLSVTPVAASALSSSVTNTVTVAVGDVQSSSSTLSATNTVTVGAGDVAQFTAKTITVSDTATIAVADASSKSGSTNPTVSETPAISVGDVATLLKQIGVSDTATVSVTQDANLQKPITASDTAAVSVTSDAELYKTIPVSDTTTVSVTMTATTGGTAAKDVTDTVTVSVTPSVVTPSEITLDRVETLTLTVTPAAALYKQFAVNDAMTIIVGAVSAGGAPPGYPRIIRVYNGFGWVVSHNFMVRIAGNTWKTPTFIGKHDGNTWVG